MKKIKVLLSLVMTITMLISISLPVCAAEIEYSDYGGMVMTEGYDPFGIDGNTRSIIGDDGRIMITDRTAYPYSAISYLDIDYPCGCTNEGTGFMASKNCMLTAGHYIICPNHGTEASTITAYFGYQSNSNYWFMAVATSSTAVIYHDPEFTGSEKNYDYGYVVFNTDVGNTTGWFGLAARNNSTLNGIWISVSGYDQSVLKRSDGTITSVSTKRIKYDADTATTQSGSPVYFNDPTYGNLVVAIPTHGTDLLNWKNSGGRITSEFINELADLGHVTKVN